MPQAPRVWTVQTGAGLESGEKTQIEFFQGAQGLAGGSRARVGLVRCLGDDGILVGGVDELHLWDDGYG